MIFNRVIKGCELTPRDVDNHNILYGSPDTKGKTKEKTQTPLVSPLAYATNPQDCEIHGDVMKLNMTSLYLVCKILPFNLSVQVPLTSLTTISLKTALSEVIGVCSSYGHTVKVIYFDLESGIRSLSGYFLAQGILLQLTNAKTHVSRVERFIQTLKGRIRTTIHNSPIKTPTAFLKLLVESTVRVMNYENNDEPMSSCPARLFGLPPLSLSNLQPWLQPGETPSPISNVSNSVFRAKTEECLALSPHSSSNGIKVWLLESQSIATRDRFFPKPMTEKFLTAIKRLEIQTFSDDSNINIKDNFNNTNTDIPVNKIGGGDSGLNDNGYGESHPSPILDHDIVDDVEESQTRKDELNNGIRKSTRNITPTPRLSLSVVNVNELKEIARHKEIQQIIEMDTLSPIVTPTRGSLEDAFIRNRSLNLFMLTKQKLNPDGSLNKWKARFVIDGSQQDKSGYDINQLSSPTPTDCIIFSMVAIASYQNWDLKVIDITSAFLNTSLHEGSQVYAIFRDPSRSFSSNQT